MSRPNEDLHGRHHHCRFFFVPRKSKSSILDDANSIVLFFFRRILGCPEGRSASTWIDFNLFGHQVKSHSSSSTPAFQGSRKYEYFLFSFIRYLENILKTYAMWCVYLVPLLFDWYVIYLLLLFCVARSFATMSPTTTHRQPQTLLVGQNPSNLYIITHTHIWGLLNRGYHTLRYLKLGKILASY